MFLGENDRVKLMLLYSGDEEDGRLVRASSGCLAMLSNNVEICERITTVITPSNCFNLSFELVLIQVYFLYVIVFGKLAEDSDTAGCLRAHRVAASRRLHHLQLDECFEGNR